MNDCFNLAGYPRLSMTSNTNCLWSLGRNEYAISSIRFFATRSKMVLLQCSLEYDEIQSPYFFDTNLSLVASRYVEEIKDAFFWNLLHDFTHRRTPTSCSSKLFFSPPPSQSTSMTLPLSLPSSFLSLSSAASKVPML